MMNTEEVLLRQSPIGTEHEIAGHIFVKTMLMPKGRNKIYANSKYGTYSKPYWMLKEEKIYSDAIGEIPPDHCVVFLDGNRKNFDIKNLDCIHITSHRMMIKNKWYGKNIELTRAAIHLCELTHLINEERKSISEKNKNIKKDFLNDIRILRKKYYCLYSEFPEVFKIINDVLDKG